MSDDEGRVDASPEECVEPERGDQAAESADESFDPFEEYQEAFPGTPTPRVMAADGLPAPVVDDVLADAHAPAFTHEKFVCIADERSFVVRDTWGEVVLEFEAADVVRSPSGRFRAQATKGTVVTSASGVLELSERLKNATTYQATDLPYGWVEVEPVRPVCRHLLQQLLPPPASLEGALRFGELGRYCSVRRTVAGAFMSLTDGAMSACSMRSPHDAKSAEVIRRFDAELLEKSSRREHFEMFRAAESALFSPAPTEPAPAESAEPAAPAEPEKGTEP